MNWLLRAGHAVQATPASARCRQPAMAAPSHCEAKAREFGRHPAESEQARCTSEARASKRSWRWTMAGRLRHCAKGDLAGWPPNSLHDAAHRVGAAMTAMRARTAAASSIRVRAVNGNSSRPGAAACDANLTSTLHRLVSTEDGRGARIDRDALRSQELPSDGRPLRPRARPWLAASAQRAALPPSCAAARRSQST